MPYKKTKLPKKLLAIALAALLMLALFPVTALAIDFTGSGNSTVTFQVGKYGEDTYDTSVTGVNQGVQSLVHESGTLPSGVTFIYTQGNPAGTGTRSIYGTPAAGTVNTYPMQYYDVNDKVVKYGFTVVVEKGPVTIVQDNISVNASAIGTTVQLAPTIKNGNNEVIPAGSTDAPTLGYAGGDGSVASVNPSGLVTIHGVGTALITIVASETDSYAREARTISVTVNKADPIVTLVGTEPSGIVGAVGDTTINVAVADSYNENIDLTCVINGITETASRSGNGNMDFAFTETELNALAAGSYPITVSSTETTNNNAISGTVVGNLYVNQTPAITGPTGMSLTEGYAAASTGAYTITGWPAVTVTKTSGDANITWNDTDKTLDIAPGLTKGTYSVTLTASNGISPDATLDFTLTVNESAPPQDTVYPFTTDFGTYTGQSEGLIGVIDANISAFTGLEVNGELLHGSNYSTNAGSTIITLHPSYLDTLDNGTYTVRAVFTDGYAEGSFIVNRQAISVTGVALDKSTASVTVGKTVQLTATVSPSNATSKGVTWESSDTSVATVDANGKVKGVKSGTATITVTTDDGGYTATCKVTVTNAADSPQTGDSGNTMLWIITGLSSILISLYLLVWRKRQQLKENA